MALCQLLASFEVFSTLLPAFHLDYATEMKAFAPAATSLRVLLVSFIPNNRWSGMGKWTHFVADGLTLLGHKPAAWFAEDFPMLANRSGLAVLLLPIALAWRLWRSRADFDVVLIHEPIGFWYGLARRFRRKLPPMIAMCHNVESRHFKDLLRFASCGIAVVLPASRFKVPLFRNWQSDGAIRLADHSICLSSVDEQYVRERLKVPAQRLTRMTNGVSVEYFRVKRGEPRARVLFVGGWLDVKGRGVLPELWRYVRAGAPHATLTIVGAGRPAESVLTDFIPADRPSIRVIPKVSTEQEMIAVYAQHDIFVMPSLSEGSSLALLEAMAAGLPVVATSVGGTSDIITDGLDGLLFWPTDRVRGAVHVCRLLENVDLALRLGEAARQRAQQLNWSRVCQSVLASIVAARSAALTGNFGS